MLLMGMRTSESAATQPHVLSDKADKPTAVLDGQITWTLQSLADIKRCGLRVDSTGAWSRITSGCFMTVLYRM